MLVFIWLLILMLMKSDAVSADTITARSGEAVVLTFDLSGLRPEHIKDIRWTHIHLVVSLKNNVTTCQHGRCSMLMNGSLSFTRVQPADSGNYSLQVFDDRGHLLKKRDFLLRVEPEAVCLSAACPPPDVSRSRSMLVQVSICCSLLLLLLIIVLFMLRRRRDQRMRAADPLQENVYVVMHGHQGNKRKNEEKMEIEEECYVPCNPVPMETPITQPTSVDGEDIYV